MKTRPRIVIFDLDGTLVDAYRAVVSSMNFTMKRLGLPLRDRTVIRRRVGWGDSHLIREFVGDELFEEARAIYRRHHKDALEGGVKFLPGANRLLAFLKKEKFRTAIATNRPSRFTHIILRYLDMRKYFDCVLCADQVGKGKPHPLILQEVLSRQSCHPGDALYVGDMTIDIEAGRRAKIKTVAVYTGSCTKDELVQMKPFRVIEKLPVLKDMLKAGTASS